jgi:hypothetical protein
MPEWQHARERVACDWVVAIHAVEGDIGLITASAIHRTATTVEVGDAAIAAGGISLGRDESHTSLKTEQPCGIQI